MLLSIYLASQQFLGIFVTAILRYISGVLCIGDVFFWGGEIFPWKSKTKQRMVFRMIHVKDALLRMGKVWSAWTCFGFFGGAKKIFGQEVGGWVIFVTLRDQLT